MSKCCSYKMFLLPFTFKTINRLLGDINIGDHGSYLHVNETMNYTLLAMESTRNSIPPF